MKKNILITCLFVFLGICLYALNGHKRPNNQYELLIEGKYYVIKDGSRIVDSLKVDSAGPIDKIILKDNQ